MGLPEGWQDAANTGMTLAFWADDRGDANALTGPHGARTFTELNAEANRLARLLDDHGLEEGDGVVLLCGNRPEFAATYAATHRRGLRLTAVNWHLTAEETSYIAEDCQAKAIVADVELADVATAVAARTPSLVTRLAAGGAIEGFDPWDDALGAHDGANIADPTLGSSMLYTSGTTGRPKGVFRKKAVPPLAAAQAVYDYRDGDRHLCTGPMYHAAPLAFSLAIPLMNGVGVTVMTHWTAEDSLRLVEADRITHTHMVPTMFHRMLALPDEVRDGYDVSTLRFVLHGAAPCPVAVKQQMMEWLGPVVHEYYGATEGVGTWIYGAAWLEHPGSVGQAVIPGTVMIGDEDANPVPAGESGLVYLAKVRGDGFEYYNDRSKTDSTYRAGGEWFTVGDVGYIDEDGWLFLTDRSAHLIISGGVNIYPAEVDEVLLTHPAVADAAAIGVPSEEWGEEVKAVVEAKPGLAADDALARALIAHCRAHLAHYKCPRSVDFVDRLPRQDNGKISKVRLRDLYR
jgi:long-chain acyl-CoA synthetase